MHDNLALTGQDGSRYFKLGPTSAFMLNQGYCHKHFDFNGYMITYTIGLQPWTSIFQFRRTKSRTQFDNIFWFVSLLSTTEKKFPKTNLHDSELMTYAHAHGRQLLKLLLHIQYYH